MFSDEEVAAAFEIYKKTGIGSHDWDAWTDLFTDDARYIEHNLGVYEGRDAIKAWMHETMAGVPSMSFDIPWSVIADGRVAFYIWNLLPDPKGGAEVYAFPNATVIEYAGDGKWCFEEDYYNPADANRVVGGWFKAGGGPHVPQDRTLRAPPWQPAPRPGTYDRAEVARELEKYHQRARTAVATGDWKTWAAQFTPDAKYHEHHYGKFDGRQAIEDWITGVMQPFPTMDFPTIWSMIDNNRVVFLCQNRLPDPSGGQGVYQFPTLVVLHYAGDGMWSYEEDIYNPDEAPPVVMAWLEAGGTLPDGFTL